MSNDLALITEQDLSLNEINTFNAKQLNLILHRTPKQYVKQRPAKGGGTWDYVTGGYVRKCLNLLTGFNWDFDILDEKVLHGEVIVKGKLTIRVGEQTITKTQYGNKDVMYRKDTDKDGNRIPLSIGNDMKAAATDCLKKCAAEIGIAADIYNKEDFREVNVTATDDILTQIMEKFKEVEHKLSDSDCIYANEVIANAKTRDYKKLLNLLNAVK